MTEDILGRVALLWRGDLEARASASAQAGRLTPIFEALAQEGVAADPAVYCEEAAAEVREQLLGVDGVLVWVDPISGGRDRSQLDPLLRDVAAHGVWVSSHPDVILKMGSKRYFIAPATLAGGPTPSSTHRPGTSWRASQHSSPPGPAC